jgi:hypothetical protein
MKTVAFAVLAGGLMALAGCAPAPPATVPVSGIVTIDGKPAAGILVQYNPDFNTGGKVVASSGVTGADGRYTLKTDAGLPGALIGKHKIVLIDNEFANGAEDANGNPIKPTKKLVNRIPQQYLAAGSTPAEMIVSADKTDYPIEVRK